MLAFFKLSPVLLLAFLMMVSNIEGLSAFFGFKLDILIIAPIACVYASLVAKLTSKSKIEKIINSAVDQVKHLQLVFFILMLAYAMAEIFMASGVGASIINLSMRLGLSAKTCALTAFLVSCVLSVATGTSWGTFAACAPIFLWMSHLLGGKQVLTLAAVISGSCFGDNLGLISDCTVVSSGIHEVEIGDRLRNQGLWALMCMLISAAIFYFASSSLPNSFVDQSKAVAAIPGEVIEALKAERPNAVALLNQVKDGVPFYMAIPLVLVIGSAILKAPTVVCLSIGIFSAFGLGRMAGTIKSGLSFLESVQSGFSSAGSWVIVMMMWVAAFGGIMSYMNAFEPISKLVIRLSKNVRQLLFYNGLMCLFGNAALSDEMAQIVTVGPIIKEISDKNVEGSKEALYRLRLRNASLSSSLGVFGALLMPWHVYIHFFASLSKAIYPLEPILNLNILSLIGHNYLAIISVVSMLVLTLTGLDRFIPGFGVPHSELRLKK